MTTAGRDLYDDDRFFEGYRLLRGSATAINDAVEVPALERVLPPVAGAAVVDLGCGTGALARRLADAGAADVLAVDSSRRMLALSTPHPRVRLLRADLDELALPASSADLVVSSLALHYVADYRGLVERVARWLRPGGWFAFSVEHPVCTAADPMTGWLRTERGTVWPVDDYAAEGPRTQHWIIEGVRKHHRRVSTLIGALLAAGLELTDVDEPVPDVATHPGLAEHLRRPPVLVLAARRGDGAG
ncbi:class I SAM-dependent methyltransferase [Saccharothrix syringae]|uniref:Class I SAM-dependent methyltransferase n=1 Tax=Saccharothrix syringae TaxID=103733 RepID=A0A5Q0GXT0_SACSY|nr:methyltransferase domain-containing protein [Saccharothrix syringae]QFZ18749.1 class I SAM-dependent methyltransferase [Saccharothrix syringae]